MPISQDLLEILCCPKTKVPVVMLDAERLARLNEHIAAGTVQYVGGETVDKPLQEALVTEDFRTVYRIDDGIPVMLIDQGISSDQLGNW